MISPTSHRELSSWNRLDKTGNPKQGTVVPPGTIELE